MRRTTPPDRTGQRLRVLVAVVVCAGLAALGIAAAGQSGLLGERVPAPPWPWLGAYAGLVAVSQRLKVQVRVRSTGYGGCWTDVVVLVGLLAMPMPWVVLATAAGVLVARLAVRRPRPAVISFSVARNSITALVGGLLLTVPGPVGELGSAAQVGWLLVAFVAMTAVGKALVVPAVTLSSREQGLGWVLADWDIELLALAARFGVAAVAVLLLAHQPQLIYAVPLLVLLAHVWHDQWLHAREERRGARALAAAIAALPGPDVDTVLRHAASRGAQLFSADAVEVELRLSPTNRLVRSGPDRLIFDGDPADAPPEPDLPNVHEMRLHGCAGQPDIGALRLRFRQGVRLSGQEQATLASYTGALEAAVRTTTAYGLLPHTGPEPVPGGSGQPPRPRL